MAAGKVKTFSCPNCGGSVSVRAAGISITAICNMCGSIIDIANDNFKVILAAAIKAKGIPLPLGSRGVFFGVEWEVIGYVERSDGMYEYEWREYLLFNPYQGFRFLVEADGHWNFVKMLRKSVDGRQHSNGISFEGDDFKIFVNGKAVVKYVMGEFYWRVKLDDKSQVADFIAPPYMLSWEKSDGDIVWSKAVYVNRDEVFKAFSLVSKWSLPFPIGVAPNQPSPYDGRRKILTFLTPVFLVALFVLQYIFGTTSLNQTIYQNQIRTTSAFKGQEVISASIDIPKDIGNIEVISYSPITNSWMELDVSLVNDATQESYDIIQPIEYYEGVDSDGAWREGSHTTSTVISAVPGGKYHLLVSPDSYGFQVGWPLDFSITVKRDVPVWGNFILAIILIVAYPLFIGMRSRRFEMKRWSASDYAPKYYREE